ncbi:MAG: NAD(P)H-dependent oxidoreductase [Pseudomonadota bacterium]
MLNAIALFSSSRRNGNTGQFVDRIATNLKIEIVDLASVRMSGYDYEHRNRNDDFEPLMKRVLEFDQLLFATPVYWYAVAPTMKVFLDRISDYLELPDLLNEGRRLRGKRAYVVCTSIYDEAPASFVNAFRDTFNYLGIHFGGVAHANCRDGYLPARHDTDADLFARQVKNAKADAKAQP